MTKISLSDGEWKLMNALWANAPCSLSRLVAAMKDETGWTKSTIFVMLRRLSAKNAVSLDTSGKIQLYSPTVAREDCAIYAAESFLSRVYNGSLGLMVSSIAEQKSLSQSEIDELRKILDDAEKSLSVESEK